jgi:hypothetical protein
VAQLADHPLGSVADVLVGEPHHTKAAQRQFCTSLGVDLQLATRGVCSVTRDFDDQPSREVSVNPGNDSRSVAVRLLQHWSPDSGFADYSQQPALEPALTTGVNQRIEKKAAAVEAAAVFVDHTRAQSLFGNQSESNRGVDRVLGLRNREFELR